MTMEELNEKYEKMPPRAMMTPAQERELVSDLFDYYEQEGFAPTFWSNGSDGFDYCFLYFGKSFTVLGRVCEVSIVDSRALWLLPMWNIRLFDGTEIAAYPDEIIPSAMRANGCPEEYLKTDCKKS